MGEFYMDDLILIEDHTSFRFAYTLSEYKVENDGVEHIIFEH